MPSRTSATIVALLTIPSLSSALTIHNSAWARTRTSPEDLFSRASTCGDASYVQCSADVPDDFCCPSSSTCMVLAGNTSALCCPTGGDCSQIEPIPCDLSLEDKSKYPSATVMTSALTGTLETCGTKCCPFGYSCGDDGTCNINADQSAKPSTSSVASSATAASTQGSTSTQTETAGVSPTSAANASPSTTSGASTATPAAGSTSSASSSGAAATGKPDTNSDDGAPASHAGLVAGGVIGGIAGVVFLGLLILFFVKRERRRKDAAQYSNDGASDQPRASSSFGNIHNHHPGTMRSTSTHPEISKPIVSETGTWRSDFSRKISTRGPPPTLHGLGLRPRREGDNDVDDDDDAVSGMSGVSYIEELDDEVSSLHEVPRTTLTTPRANPNTSRAVSSMYGSFYDPNDPARQSPYLQQQAPPLKMPSARAYGGFDQRASIGGSPSPGRDWLGDPLSYYGAGSSGGAPRAGGSGETDGAAAYINVFADGNALRPPPLGFAEREKRETRFSDFGRPPRDL